ncbi:MAG TPA: cupin domain-containing protein [Alphaproteobacteria bacterium]|nr:cupin domain-containing protein [Alphaproteobacteria bacterium]
MSPRQCEHAELTCAYVLGILTKGEAAAIAAHIAECPHCRGELDSLRPVIDWFVSWPTDVLRPSASLQTRLALRISHETREEPPPFLAGRWLEPEWSPVAPGIECRLLATDEERSRVSMLVRLARGASYPAHTHAGIEELYLLAGELRIDERLLVAGDYNYGAPGTSDRRVWTETGCTCLLVTSTRDVLR